MADKVYLKCQAKAHTFTNGGQIIKLSIAASELRAFSDAHANQAGYVNLVVAERREPGQYGDTHYVYLDAFTPKATPAPSRRQADPDDDIAF